MVKYTEDVQKVESTKELIREIERNGNYNGIDHLFVAEEKLLNHLFQLEKEEARQMIRLIIDAVSKHREKGQQEVIKYYFITLSSLIARHLEKGRLTARAAFAFNVTCCTLIDMNLKEHNFLEVADELIEFYLYVLAEKKLPTLMHNTVNRVLYYIDEDIKSPLTVEGISKKFEVSTSHLSRIFREHTGVTLIEYINIKKVEESQYYLRFSSSKIADISDQFHFCNQSYFTRIFKKYTGQTPKRFRSNLSDTYFKFALPTKENML